MKKIYILIEDKNLQTVLCDILEILSFLAITVDKEQNKFLKYKEKQTEDVVFTDYYNIKSENVILNNFKKVILITAISVNFLPLKDKTKNITYFNKLLTIKNVKHLLQKLKILI